MNKNDLLNLVNKRYKDVKKGKFPDHIVAQAAVVASSAGDILSKSIEFKYHNECNKEQLIDEAVNTIVASIIFIEKINA